MGSSVTGDSSGPHDFSFWSYLRWTSQRVGFSPERLARVPERTTSARSAWRERTVSGVNWAKLTRPEPRRASRATPRALQ
jgi:hypothetical protein